MRNIELILVCLFIFACGFTTGGIIVNNFYGNLIRKNKEKNEE